MELPGNPNHRKPDSIYIHNSLFKIGGISRSGDENFWGAKVACFGTLVHNCITELSKESFI